jgi:hypothetical protein
MSNFLNFHTTFWFCVANLIGGHRDLLPISYPSVTPWFLTLLVWRSQRNSIQRKSRANWKTLVSFKNSKTQPLDLSVCEQAECLWVSIEHPLNASKFMYMPLSDCEQPLNIHCHWVRMNANEWVWTPIECAWMLLSYYWMQLTVLWPWERTHLCENWTVPECDWVGVINMSECEHPVNVNTFEWVLNTLWMLLSESEHLGVSIGHLLTAIECMWTPLSDCEQPLNIRWVCMNVIEWVWTPIECGYWIIIECNSLWCDPE